VPDRFDHPITDHHGAEPGVVVEVGADFAAAAGAFGGDPATPLSIASIDAPF
jgi:hypothetical protein